MLLFRPIERIDATLSLEEDRLRGALGRRGLGEGEDVVCMSVVGRGCFVNLFSRRLPYDAKTRCGDGWKSRDSWWRRATIWLERCGGLWEMGCC